MISNVSGLLIFLTVCGIVVSSPDRAIDCRKFVFAPLCRGVAAKRTPLENANIDRDTYVDGKSLKEILKSLYIQAELDRWKEESDEQMRKATNGQEIGENVGRKYQQDRDDILHKLLAKSNKINSDTSQINSDSIPASFYENL